MNPGPVRKDPRPVATPWPGEDGARWRRDGNELVEFSQHSRVWLRMRGAATPVEFTAAITREQAAAMGVHSWAPRLVTDLLSRREYEVFLGYARGLTNMEVAELLCISTKTVSELYVRGRRKTGLRNQTECAIYAFRHGLVKWGPLPQIEATAAQAIPPEVCASLPASARGTPALLRAVK
jgi:DNA-binding CsgD family transcriptional regulator